MRIFISDFKGREFEFNVSGSTTVRELKYLLSSRIHNGVGNFLFDGQVMRDNYSLDYYFVEDGDTITCSPESRGGPPIVNESHSSNINCTDKRGKVGEVYGYNITGSTEGTVWGDGIYTDDSNIAKAAVLEGKCKIGENCTVCIKIIESKSSYGSRTKNGISTSSYGHWDGSHTFVQHKIKHKQINENKLPHFI